MIFFIIIVAIFLYFIFPSTSEGNGTSILNQEPAFLAETNVSIPPAEKEPEPYVRPEPPVRDPVVVPASTFNIGLKPRVKTTFNLA